jgi:hypothetical protein
MLFLQAKDPQSVILLDIANRCGFTGNAKKQIMVKYTITLKINILAITVSPSFSGQAGFDCPLSREQIQVSVKPFCYSPCLTISRPAIPWKSQSWWLEYDQRYLRPFVLTLDICYGQSFNIIFETKIVC